MASAFSEEYRRRLFLLFEKYDPPRLNTLLAILTKAEGKEGPFMAAMVKRYGPEPPYTPFPEEAKAALRDRLHAFYSRHDPSKLAGIPNVVIKYVGAEPELFAQLSRKYEDGGGGGQAAADTPASPPASPTAKGPAKAAAKRPPTAAIPKPAAAAATAPPSGPEALRARVVRFYQHYDPTKIPSVNALVTKYGDDPEKLITALVKKYGPEPQAPATAAASSAAPRVMTEGTPVGAASAAKPAAKAAAPAPEAASVPASPTSASPSPPSPAAPKKKVPTKAAAKQPTPTSTPDPQSQSQLATPEATPPPEGSAAASVAHSGSPAGSEGSDVRGAAKGEGTESGADEKGGADTEGEGGGAEKASSPDGDGGGMETEKSIVVEARDDGEESLAARLGAVGDGGDAANGGGLSSHQQQLPVLDVSLRLLAAAAFDYFEDAGEALELCIVLYGMLEGAGARGEEEGGGGGGRRGSSAGDGDDGGGDGAAEGGREGSVSSDGGGGPPSAAQVVEYLRAQLGDQFIAYLRGFSASNAGIAASAAAGCDLGGHRSDSGVHATDHTASGSGGGGGGGGAPEWAVALAERLRATFGQFEPSLEGLSGVLALGCQGRADDLIVAVHARYATQIGDMRRRDLVAAQFRRRIDDFILYHCPQLASLSAFLADCFGHNKEELMRDLRRLYGPEPTIVDPSPLRLYTAEARRADRLNLRTSEGALEQCCEHFRLLRYLISTSALTSGGAATALGVAPSQWSNTLYRAVVGALLELFRGAARAVECLSYALGPEEVAAGGGAYDYHSPTNAEVALVSECLSRHKAAANPVFLLINNDVVVPIPNAKGMGREALISYFVELIDEALAPRPLSKAGRDAIARYVWAHPELMEAGSASPLGAAKGAGMGMGMGSLRARGAAAHRLIDSAAVEAAAEFIYQSHGRDEEQCLAQLASTYGALPPLPASGGAADGGEATTGGDGYAAEDGFAASGIGGFGGMGLSGIGVGGGGGGSIKAAASAGRRAQLACLVEEEARIRQLISFEQYQEASTAMSRARTAADSLRVAQQLAAEMRRWRVPASEIMGNPFA